MRDEDERVKHSTYVGVALEGTQAGCQCDPQKEGYLIGGEIGLRPEARLLANAVADPRRCGRLPEQQQEGRDRMRDVRDTASSG